MFDIFVRPYWICNVDSSCHECLCRQHKQRIYILVLVQCVSLASQHIPCIPCSTSTSIHHCLYPTMNYPNEVKWMQFSFRSHWSHRLLIYICIYMAPAEHSISSNGCVVYLHWISKLIVFGSLFFWIAMLWFKWKLNCDGRIILMKNAWNIGRSDMLLTVGLASKFVSDDDLYILWNRPRLFDTIKWYSRDRK